MRIFKRIVLIGLAGLMLVAGLAYLYIFELGGMEKLVNTRLLSALGQRYRLDIRVGSISGSLWSGVTLKDITVLYADSVGSVQLLSIPRLSAAYSLSNLWRREYTFEHVLCDSVTVTLARDSTGHWRLPDVASGSPASSGSPISFAIGEFLLTGGHVAILTGSDTFHVRNLNMSAGFEVREHTYSVDLEFLSFSPDDTAYSVRNARGKATISGESIVFNDVVIETPKSLLKLEGNFAGGEQRSGALAFSIDNLEVSDVGAWLARPLTGRLDINGSVGLSGASIDGSATIAGDFMHAGFDNLFVGFRVADRRLHLDTLYGTILGTCAIDGSGEIDFAMPTEQYWLDAEIKNFKLQELVRSAFPTDLTGHIYLSGESFRRDKMQLHVTTQLVESSLNGYSLHGATGDLIITASSICFADSFRIDYYENDFLVNGCIDYREDLYLTVDADLGNLDRYRGKFFIKEIGGRGSLGATLSGRTADPDLQVSFVSDSVWLYGLYTQGMSASANVRRFLTGKEGTVDLTCSSGTAWGLPYSSASVALTVDSANVRFAGLRARHQYGDIAASGRLEYGSAPMRLTIDTMSLTIFEQTFHNYAGLIADVDSDGFNVTQAVIGTSEARLSCSGRVNYDESMSLLLSLQHVPVRPWLNLADTTIDVNGSVSCRAQVGGTFGQPEFAFVGQVDSLTYQDIPLGTLMTGVRYANRVVTLDSVLIRSATGEYRGHGQFHADLAFASGVLNRYPDLPIDVVISAVDRRFDLVSLVLPSVEQLEGDFFANVVLSGTPHAPHLEGEAYIKGARLKYFDLEEPLYSDSAGVTMQDNRIIIDRIDLYVSDKSRRLRRADAYIEGEIVVRSLTRLFYDLDVRLPKEFPFTYELEDIRGVIEGELHVEGESPPLVTGDLTVISMKYLVPFADDEEGSPVLRALAGENSWDLNLNIDVLANYWIKNEDIDAEFAGQVNLVREAGVYRFIGEMEILRGRGFLFDKTFRLEPGSRVIFGGEPTINPRLDITGYTRIAGVAQSSVDEAPTSEPLELGIHVTGTLEAPEINPIGEGLNREDILPLLVANYYGSDTVSSTGKIEQRLSGLLSTQVSQIGTRQLAPLGVETFEIDPMYGEKYDPLRARVTVGLYTAPNLYVFGRSTLSGQTRQEVGFEYRLNKALLVEGLRDEQQLYRLALKLHWEF
ncbi:MAG TPA: translocation/assembly module TamB domain-containing protein [Candidatus Deferrimicrobium sp.]|nr:translocation/assembly module TamB domain-containing protein [Candidatus Deferrimicrobium sp.]